MTAGDGRAASPGGFGRGQGRSLMAAAPASDRCSRRPLCRATPDVSDTSCRSYLRTFSLWCAARLCRQAEHIDGCAGRDAAGLRRAVGTAPQTFVLRVDYARERSSATPVMIGGRESAACWAYGADAWSLSARSSLAAIPITSVLYTADSTLNNAGPNGGVLRFDTIDGNSPICSPAAAHDRRGLRSNG